MNRHKQAQERIKVWLLLGRAITPIIALNRFKCFRLSSVIHRLRRQGLNIDTHIVNPGTDNSYARYSIVKLQKANSVHAPIEKRDHSMSGNSNSRAFMASVVQDARECCL